MSETLETKMTLVETATMVQTLYDEFDRLDNLPEGSEISGGLLDTNKQAIIELIVGAENKLCNKTDRWVGFLESVKASIEIAKERQDRATKHRKILENVMERSKQYIQFALEQSGKTKFEGNDSTITLQNSPQSVDFKLDFKKGSLNYVLSEDQAHALAKEGLSDYVTEVSYFVLNSDKVRSDLQLGKEIPFATIKQNKHIRIK